MNRKLIGGLLAVLIIGGGLRLVGLNWDQNYHLHPDERFLTMVTLAQKWPRSIGEYFDTQNSPLNPHNAGFDFFVYGTLPLFIVKAAAESLRWGDYNHLTLVGRAISAVFDLGTIALVFSIGKKMMPKIGLLAAFLYATMVLPIQLAHYFAVDTFLVFFLTLAFFCLVKMTERGSGKWAAAAGTALGLALACKISAAVFAATAALAFGMYLVRFKKPGRTIILGILFCLAAGLTLRAAQPYLFIDGWRLNPKVIANWKELESWERADVWYPPGTQWIHTPHYIYPLENISLWGLGLPLAMLTLAAITYALKNLRRQPEIGLSLFWIGTLFAYQGVQYAMPIRYFYPIFPNIALVAGAFLGSVKMKTRLLTGILVLTCVWPVSFMQIYLHPVTRVTAGEWIYSHVPAGKTLSCEHWDDCLPLGYQNQYPLVEFPLYDQDNPGKWQVMRLKLAQADYIVLSSNRLYGSIMTVSERYPQTTRFYEELFAGSLGFKKVAEFTSRPNLPIPGIHWCITPPGVKYGRVALAGQECPQTGISFVDDYADETFTVYDHPKVIIFKKM